MGSPLRRVSVSVRPALAEAARATMLELFPEGFEEREADDGVELVAYTNAGGEERIWQVFGGASSSEDVADGWAERWREFHQPVRIGPLWVGPPWEEPPDEAVAVVIDPGRAFGTGAHPTTRLCLELLVELPRGALLDLGCGSGVLAIAAAKLGHAPVTAVDVDANALEAARVNAAANAVSLEIAQVDAGGDVAPGDVTVANISLETVNKLSGRIASPLLITSGYLLRDEPRLSGYRHRERRDLDGWAADVWEVATE